MLNKHTAFAVKHLEISSIQCERKKSGFGTAMESKAEQRE